MHPNPIFRSADAARDLEFVRARGFGILSVNGPEVPLMAHVPVVLEDGGAALDLHLVRSNLIARAAPETAPAGLTVSGPDGYVSPDWYGVADQVPTWNYVAVHVKGTLERRPDAEMRAMLDRQSAAFEARLAPKPEWVVDKMTEDTLARFLRMIVPYRLHIASVAATWKLNQNKPDAVRLAAADAIVAGGIGQELAALAALMRAPPGP